MRKIYTRTGDAGSTALFSGTRVQKDDARIWLLGSIDESQAALGVARAECRSDPLGALLESLERDLWKVMAEVAVEPEKRKGEPGVTAEMVTRLEQEIDRAREGVEVEPRFSVPGGGRLSAALDYARTIVRRAERHAVGVDVEPVLLAYLNRLSDLCWALARAAEDEHLVQGEHR